MSAIMQVVASASQQTNVHADNNCYNLSDVVSVHTCVPHAIAESPLTAACFTAGKEHRAAS